MSYVMKVIENAKDLTNYITNKDTLMRLDESKLVEIPVSINLNNTQCIKQWLKIPKIFGEK